MNTISGIIAPEIEYNKMNIFSIDDFTYFFIYQDLFPFSEGSHRRKYTNININSHTHLNCSCSPYSGVCYGESKDLKKYII